MDLESLRFARDVFSCLAAALLLLWAFDAGWPAVQRWRAQRRQRRILRTVMPPPSPLVYRRQRRAWPREWRA